MTKNWINNFGDMFRQYWWNYGDQIWFVIIVLMAVGIIYGLGPKDAPEKMSELLTDEWSTSQIYSLYKRMECEESVNLVGSQCYVIGKIHDQKLAKQPKDHIIKNDVTRLDGEIVVGN